MELSTSARVLFDLFDQAVQHSAEALRDRVLSEYQDLPLSSEQRKALEPLIREQLYEFVQVVLGAFNNVGGAIPDTPESLVGYRIRSLNYEEPTGNVSEGDNIATDHMDYADMWWEYLQAKR